MKYVILTLLLSLCVFSNTDDDDYILWERSKLSKCKCKVKSCDNFTREQEDCVIKKRCYPEIRKLVRENKQLREEIEFLKEQMAILKVSNDLEYELKRLNDNAEKAWIKPKRDSFSFIGVSTFKGQTDGGLMYQHDFGDQYRVRGSFGMTIRGYGFAGLGLNF